MKYATRKKKAARPRKRVRRKSVVPRRKRASKRASTRLKNPPVKAAKLGSWYAGPGGVRVRVRRVAGKTVVDVKKSKKR